MNKLTTSDTRALAALVLVEVLVKGCSLSQALPLYAQQVAERDKGLLQELCFGCLRYLPKLLLILEELAPKPIKAKDTDIKALILLGLYQLEYTRIPDHAAIDATVEASKRLQKDWASKFINGLLRGYQREKSRVDAKFAKNPNYLYAHPQWLLDKIRSAWPEHWQAVLDANNTHPPLCLRINQRVTDRDTYQASLADKGLEASPTLYSPVGLLLTQAVAVTQLPNFAEGYCSVQDEAAQLAAGLMDLQPGRRVLDACCAPGGKTCHLLEAQPALQSLLAIDVDAGRMNRVAENLARLRLSAITQVADLSQVDRWWDGVAFDRILLDAPCSATGVIRRHPDIKTLRRASDIPALTKIQLHLLTQLWPCLAPGGRLVYATCSVLPEENYKLVAQFLSQTQDAEHIPLDAPWGLPQAYGRQLLPQIQGHDGFYYAVLQKNAGPEVDATRSHSN